MNKRYLIGFTRLAVLLAGMVAVLPVLAAADVPDSDQVNQLLSDAKAQAYQISLDASTMESYTRSGTSWESHAAAVNVMKEHINAAGRTITKLEDARKTASPWQATAMDRIKPLLAEIASNTDKVIQYLNKNPKRLFLTEYKDHIESNSDVAAQLAGLVADFVNYGNTKNRMERLGSKLELPGK